MIGLIRKLFWVVLFLLSTLCFVVLFEHGTKDFGKNLRKEIEGIKKLAGEKPERPADPSEAVAR